MNTRTLSRPKYIHKKISNFLDKNKDILLDAGKDGISELIFNDEIINTLNFNPSIAITIYVLVLIIYIIF